MSTRALENVFLWGTKLFLWLIPFVSLIISSSTLFPYIVGKNIAFRALVELAFVLWAGLVFLKKEYRPRFSPLSIAALAFLVIVTLADVFGVNPFRSFWSNFERMEGLIGLMHLVAYFFILSSVFRAKSDWFVFFNVFAAAGIINGIYGLLQELGALRSIQGGFRIDGTIGNPTYFAAYLLLVVIAVVYLAFTAEKRWLQWTYAGIAAFFLVMIYFAASRGVTVGIGAAALFFAVGYLVLGKGKTSALGKKIAIGLLAAAVIVPAGLFALKNTSFIKSSEALSRIASFSFTETTIRSRFMIWRMALQAWQERPLLGWGQENFIEPFVKYYNPKLGDQEPWFDRAHNVFFDRLVDAGILGLLAYLGIFAGAGIALGRALKRGTLGFHAGLAFAAGLFAYLVQNLFVFDNLNTYLLFFAFLAFLEVFSRPAAANAPAAVGVPTSVGESAFVRSVVAGTIALIAVVFTLSAGNYKPWRQAQGVIRFLGSRLSPETVAAVIEDVKRNVAYGGIGLTETREQLGQRAMEFTDATFVAYAAEELERHLAQFPNDPRMRIFLGTLYTRVNHLNPRYLERAKIHLEYARAAGPRRQVTLLSLAEYFVAVKEYENAIATVREAALLAPQIPEPRAAFAQIAILTGRDDLISEALAPDRNVQVLMRVGDVYMQLQKPHLAYPYYREIAERKPRWSAIWSRLADTLSSLQQYDEAIAAAQKYLEREPAERERVEAFIATMERLKRGE